MTVETNNFHDRVTVTIENHIAHVEMIRANKMVLNTVAYLSPAEALLLESKTQEKLLGSSNQLEAVMSELEGRPAKFSA